MKYCTKCGFENADTSTFCVSCGEPIVEESPVVEQEPVVQQVPPVVNTVPQYQPQQPTYAPAYVAPAAITEDMLPHELKPVTAGEFFGYTLLFGIPLVGFIMLFVVAFGSSYKKSLRNYAKYYLILYLVMTIIMVVIMLLAIFAGGMFAGGMDYYY